jgi:DNA-binding response OmpR family regulator
LVEAMRGSIRIESDVRTGTTARLTLMLVPSRAFAAVQMGEQESIELGRFNVLLIEDDAAVLGQLESTTSRLGGCRTIVARSASRGLDVALETLPEVVIVDADLPDVGGADFLRKVWKVPELRKTKFIVIGSKREELQTFRSAGASSFLCKPLDCDELAASVDALKERAGL